jgi:hypothetical protein
MEPKLIATQSSNSLTFDRQSIEGATTDPTLAIATSIAILTAMSVSTYAYISKELHKPLSRKPCERTLCHSCEYFNNNLYLNCALHPTLVSTEAARDCLDYCPNSQAKRSAELKKVLPFTSKFFPDRSN